MKWIFGSFAADALVLIAPGLLAFSFGPMLADNAIYLLLALVFADAGHVYTTLWRTWFHPTERRRTAMMWMIPLGVTALFFTWTMLKLPYLATFAIYAALAHNMNQFTTITRWYSTLNQRSLGTFFSRALMILPVVAWCFKPGAMGGFYAANDFLHFPNEQVFTSLMWINAALACAWAGYEARRFNGEWNRIFSIAFSSALYAGCFYIGKNVAQVTIPLIIAHGIAYIGLTSVALQRSRPRYFAASLRAFGVVAVTALAFGALHRISQTSLHAAHGSWLEAALVTGYMVPLFSHFLYDLILWRDSHWESRLLTGLTNARADVATIATPAHVGSSKERAS